MVNKRDTWSGHLAFILACAASAIGLGNLWRFPYLAAQYGGGCFILVYLVLSLTLGFTLLVTEVSIGRASRQSQLTAFTRLGGRKWGWVGVLSTIVPFLILPYYSVIGGWVVRYMVHYASAAAFSLPKMSNPAEFFVGFTSSGLLPVVYMTAFVLITMAVILCGVKRGIEKTNVIMMPLLLVTAIAICVYVAFLPGAKEGILYYLVPDFSRCDNIGKIFLGALGQMFFSLSLAMGIMVTYGSYMRSDSNISHSAVRIVAADTFVAMLSGFMVIPVVYLFAVSSGLAPETELAKSGPGLLFVSLPEIFGTFGPIGNFLALAFFLLVFFAAVTSAISMTEACVAALCDYFHSSRVVSSAVFAGYSIAVGVITAVNMKALDFVDAVVNSLLMPITAIGIAVFAGWVYGADKIVSEVESCGVNFAAKKYFRFSLRYVAPVLVAVIFVSEVCRALGLFEI